MAWNADVAYRIGVDHEECQDHVGMIQTDRGSLICVSDGCSSSKDSDLGSRLLTAIATSRWRSGMAFNLIPEECIFNAHQIIINVPNTSHMSGLDATLILASMANDICDIIMWGDGTYIIVNTDKSWEIHTVEFKSNAPEYLSYLVNPPRHEQYKAAGDHTKVITVATYSSDNVLTGLTVVESVKQYESWTIPNVDSVFICSDGISSFTHRKALTVTVNFNADEIAKELIAIPNRNGDFLKRRWKKMRQKFEKNGISHSDDFSVAALVKVP
jgi:hypothetical protein